MKTFYSVLTLAVAMAGLGLAGTVAAPVSKVIPDIQIQHTIEAKFARSKINAEHFTVSVRGGVATIEGKTGVIQHKGVATRLAKTGGAIAVRNNIKVSDEAKLQARARLESRQTGIPASGQVARAAVMPRATEK